MQIRELTKDEYMKAQVELNTHPLQSWQWGELKSENWTPVRLGVVLDNAVVAVVLILSRSLPATRLSLGYIPRGIVSKEDISLSEILRLIVEYGRAIKLSHLMIDPEVSFRKYLANSEKYNKEISDSYGNAKLRQKGLPIQPHRTAVLDLAKTEDELLSNMRSKHRQYIRKAEKNGVTIREGGDSDLNSFCTILDEIASERGYITHSDDYYKKVWDLFSKTGNAKIFIAEHKGSVVGSYLIITNKENAFEMYGGAHQHGRNLKANYLMKWSAIRYFKENGFQFYDQWGAENIYPGLVQFKEGFSKDIVEYPNQYVYVYSKVGFLYYKLLDSLNKLLQKMG